jgi:hypothetical protein
MTRGPIEIFDADGVTRLKGTSEPAIGGTAEQATYDGDSVLIANGANAYLPFTNLDTGVDLLDRSDPLACTVLADGTYAISVDVGGDALTAGGHSQFDIVLPSIGAGATVTSLFPDEQFSASIVAVLAAGDAVRVLARNDDGVAARNLGIFGAVVVKL